MQLIDEAIIEVCGGKGGDGCIAFRREKYCPHGGPAGGDGGAGGDVILIADPGLHTLLDFHYQRFYRAENGEHGRGKDQHGKRGRSIELRVPVGTLVYDAETGKLLGDLTRAGQKLIVARGGKGGKGNLNFVTPTRRAPHIATPGEKGERRTLKLELKLIADIGIIGFPNVGKSTLISKISRARPKIADYPFTTLSPNLGVVSIPGRNPFVVADVPGLIPGAHKGIGLGHRFLKHVERTRLFLHLLEYSLEPNRDPIKDFEALEKELKLYDQKFSSNLSQKRVVVALNKMDDPEIEELCREEYSPYFAERGIPFLTISALSGKGLKELLHLLADQIEKLNRTTEKSQKEEQWTPV